ncbi:MAG: ABC transporter substrate-binding protein, partial [Cenarchaeum sp. SB0665_bin_23]|nr:ABC transporter substrate-binding protein [Cenarchaeum sp. SB0665_bin_23]
VTGLTDGTTYEFRVSAVNGAGTGTASGVASTAPYTTPGAPTGLTATPSSTSVSLSWVAPTSDGGNSITDYTIEYRAEGGSWSVYADGTSTTTSATVTGLTDGTTYEFRVSAVNAMGTGKPSNVVSILYAAFDVTTDSDDILLNTLSISPRFTNFLVAPDNGRVILSWNASQMEGQNATGYIVQYREHAGFWQNFLYWDSSSSIIITNLTNNVVYDFRIIPITDLVIEAVAEQGIGIPTSTHPVNITTMNIGVIVSSTGALANEGQTITEVIHYAVDEFNRYLEMHNRAWRLGIFIYNDDSSASGGLTGVSAFNDAGIKTVVGPATSASLDGAMEYIYDNDLLVISYGSTAPTLAHDDTVFRTTIDDSNTAKIYAAALQHDGISHVISVIRDDVWGVALNDALRASLTNSSIVLDEIKYHPNTTEYDEVIAQIQHNLRPDSTTAVVTFSFDEIKDIVDTAMLHESLSKIKWYHSDTDIDFILDNNTRREFMSVVNFTTITPTPPKNEINAKINQIVPNAGLYSYAAYDAIQIIGKTFDELGLLANTAALADAIPAIASAHPAALGNTTLNDAGDIAYSDYVVDTVINGKKTTTHKYILVDGSYYSIIHLPHVVAE